MSNRVLGILILLGFILAGIGIYLYAFVYYTGSLRIESNIGGYSVQLEPDQITKTIVKECPEEFCLFGELSPFHYEMIVSKLGYTTIRENIIIGRNESKTVAVRLEKEVVLEKVNIQGENIDASIIEDNIAIDGDNVENGNITLDEGNGGASDSKIKSEDAEKKLANERKEKLKYLRNSMKNYAYFEFLNVGEIFFKQKNNKIEASLVDEFGDSYSIHAFSQKVPKDHISVLTIDGDDSGLIIIYGDKKYLFHKRLGTFEELDMKLGIDYVKDLGDGLYGFKTEKGLFQYEIQGKKEFEYFTMFSDYVIDGENYVGLIEGSDDRRKKNMNLENENGDLIVLHNTDKKENTVLKRLNFTLQKLLKNEDQIELVDIDGEIFLLKNYK